MDLHEPQYAWPHLGMADDGAPTIAVPAAGYRSLTRQVRATAGEMDHLVRALSHDMRANLMLLEHSFGQLRRDVPDDMPAAASEDMDHLEACLNQSKRFLNDLVALAKTGRLDMEPQRVQMADVVEKVLFEHQQMLDERGIEITVAPPLPVVWCNRLRLKQIVTNLIRNTALHGCDRDRPKIEISARLAEEFVDFRIADNGRGIPMDARRRIFEPGERLAGAGAEGSGIGLSIVARIVEYYGGSVVATSLPGWNTVFEVRLPASPQAMLGPESRIDSADESTQRPTKAPRRVTPRNRSRC